MKVTFKPSDVLLPISIPRHCPSKHFLIVGLIISSLKEVIFGVSKPKDSTAIPHVSYHLKIQFLTRFNASKEKLVSR